MLETDEAAKSSNGASAMRTLPMIISVDDHVIEPPHVWQDRLPSKFRAAGPRVVRRKVGKTTYTGSNFTTDTNAVDGDDADCWVFGDLVKIVRRNIAGAGLPREQMDLNPISFADMRPGCYDPKARLLDMDLNHVEASMCFPSFPRFCGQEFTECSDRELGLLCVKAYNDWMVEEWCATDPARLIPLCILPLWDAELAAAEVRRNAARGVHAVTFSEVPAFLGLPSIHSGFWDPFFQACEETKTTVCMHIGSSSRMQSTSTDAPPAVDITLSCNNAIVSLTDFLFSGILVRYPKLLLAYSESQIGWIPYFLERADTIWMQHRAWNGLGDSIPEPPSTYFRRQIFGCFFQDFFGLKALADIGVDNVTYEVDYPHTDSTWPNSAALAVKMLEGIDDDTAYKVVRGNAIRMLSLDLV